MDDKNPAGNHRAAFSDRRNGCVTGVKDVISFDLKTIVLETVCGMMVIKGHDLHVNRLSVDKGELDISGTIDAIKYSDVNSYAKKSESLLCRLINYCNRRCHVGNL